jgi:hypothetical protein
VGCCPARARAALRKFQGKNRPIWSDSVKYVPNALADVRKTFMELAMTNIPGALFDVGDPLANAAAAYLVKLCIG